jgi:FO synthase
MEEIQRRVIEAWDRGATEVCLQGGIHPDYTGATYLAICRGIKAVVPQMHIHAFSPLEVWQGAKTLGLPLRKFLSMLKEAGLSSLPGTAAEVLHDEVRAELCPDKIRTAQWLEVIEAAHEVGLRTTATIMYGHVDQSRHWASHLLAIRDLQARTGGFTEFVPLPFVSMEAPMYLRARCRPGPTFREAVLMHAVARLLLFPLIDNIQTSWVKLGREGAQLCLEAGCNDLGGSLMDESITRAAGAIHGQEFAPAEIRGTIEAMGRVPRHRSTTYEAVAPEITRRAENAPPLTESINTPAGKTARIQCSPAPASRPVAFIDMVRA